MMICSEGYLGNAGSGCNFQGLQVLQATCSFSGMFRNHPNVIKIQRLDPLQRFTGRIQAWGGGDTSIGRRGRNPEILQANISLRGASFVAIYCNWVKHI